MSTCLFASCSATMVYATLNEEVQNWFNGLKQSDQILRESARRVRCLQR